MNIRWWFWDDAATPGLITGAAFSELCDAALSEAENGRLSVALVEDRVVTNAGRGKRASNADIRLLQKVDAYLRAARDAAPEALDRWVKSKWTRSDADAPMLDVLKAYINVLEGWGYPYTWQVIKDARDIEPATLLLAAGRASHFFLESDIREINGRPHEFSIWVDGRNTASGRVGGGNWHFHYEDGGFDMRFFDRAPPTNTTRR
jgi:hypothetical protein